MVQDNYVTYLTGLTTASAIVSAWGSTFTLGTNLYVYVSPETVLNTITITPYAGYKPDTAKPFVYYPNIQIWIKHKTPKIVIHTGEEMIKAIHRNPDIINGVIFSLDSSPRIIGLDDRGIYNATVNFQNKYVTS